MTIDLESLRGFTPGPWRAGDEHGAEQLRPSIRILRDVTYVEGARPTTYVIGEATYPTTVGNTVGAEERRANAALIAAAPSMHAELLARRARDAETFDPSLLLAIGPALIFGANNFQTALPTGRWLVWDKRRPDGTHFVSQAELAWCSKGRGVEIFQHCWQGFARASENSEHYHPTQKPIALMQHCIGMLGKPETVCDPYMGAGSTGVAAAREGCRFVGIEIERRYFDIACERIENEQRQARMFG